jgi:hypothetical protein
MRVDGLRWEVTAAFKRTVPRRQRLLRGVAYVRRGYVDIPDRPNPLGLPNLASPPPSPPLGAIDAYLVGRQQIHGLHNPFAAPNSGLEGFDGAAYGTEARLRVCVPGGGVIKVRHQRVLSPHGEHPLSTYHFTARGAILALRLAMGAIFDCENTDPCFEPHITGVVATEPGQAPGSAKVQPENYYDALPPVELTAEALADLELRGVLPPGC